MGDGRRRLPDRYALRRRRGRADPALGSGRSPDDHSPARSR